MLKAFLCSSSFFLLHSLSISQNLHLKGQLLASSITSNDVPDNWQAYESIFSYVPTLSFKKKNTTNELIDFEWAYKLNKYYVGDSLYDNVEDSHRLWVRYSNEKIEARFGLQKIIFGPTQILRPLSWFDTFNIKDPSGQTDGVEAFKLQYFSSNMIGLSSWVINNKVDTLTYGGRGEITTALGDFGFTYHKDPSRSKRSIGQIGTPIVDSHKRIAFDYRYDGFIGFWNESVIIKSTKSNINLISIGADYTLPFLNGVYVMIESMHIQNEIKNLKSNQNFSAYMASLPIGIIHQATYISQKEWGENKTYQYLRWSSTYDSYSLNFIIYMSPKRNEYNMPLNSLPKALSGFGTGIQFMFIYNH